MTGQAITAGLLAVAVLASALGLVVVHHEHRSLFAELQEANDRGDRLRQEWRRLQLEEGARAGHSRLERVAREDLDMAMPSRSEIVILRPADE